jgi:predicted site-specific integrase-resolvase
MATVQYVTTRQATKVLAVSRWTLQRYRRAGLITRYRLPRGQYRWRLDDLYRLLERAQ